MIFALTLIAKSYFLSHFQTIREGTRPSFASRIQKVTTLRGPQFSKFARILAVSNDGLDVLTFVGSRIGGYHLGMGYALDPEYPDRLVFPPAARELAKQHFDVIGIIRCLERGLGLAALFRKQDNENESAFDRWAVFPIDRRVTHVNTNIVRFPQKARLVSASINIGGLLTCRVAEDDRVRSRRVNLVDYSFQVDLSEGGALSEAKMIRRRQLVYGYSDLTNSTGKRYRRYTGTLGWVSADARFAVFSSEQLRINLLDGKETHFTISGRNHNASMFYLGNELFRSIWASPYAAVLGSKDGAGLWQWSGNVWNRQSDLYKDTMSANGKYGVFVKLPMTPGGNPEWSLIEFKR